MTISTTLSEHLQRLDVKYDLIPHPHTESSMQSAQKAHVPGNQLAKGVVVRDGDHYAMVVVPSAKHIDRDWLRSQFGDTAELASEADLSRVFYDCAPGAVPPIGKAWGLDTYLDESLVGQPEVYFEAGDHEDLVRLSGEDFEALLKDAERGAYSQTI